MSNIIVYHQNNIYIEGNKIYGTKYFCTAVQTAERTTDTIDKKYINFSVWFSSEQQICSEIAVKLLTGERLKGTVTIQQQC